MDRRVRRYVQVRFQWIGYHYWADAPEEEEFLRYPHRHVFKARVEIEVVGADRELEFFALQKWIRCEVEPHLPSSSKDPARLSCEDMAALILERVQAHPYVGAERYMEVYVSEDGENGGRVTWDPEL